MSRSDQIDEIDLYVWEGSSDVGLKAERFLANSDISVIRVDASTSFLMKRKTAQGVVALVSVSVIGDGRFIGHDWLTSHAIPVIWVASEERGYDPRFYPPAFSYTLPLSFTAAELRALTTKLASLTADADVEKPEDNDPSPLVAVSEEMRTVLAEAQAYANCEASVLVQGETGVGKERIARLLHDGSSRAKGPFVAVNCGAVPDGLFEAHFFGHAKGAFTGAIGAHKGYFEQADNGTLFLDEIGDLPLYQQVKLLRILEQSTVTRLGSTTEIPVSFRMVAATHRNLQELVEKGQFRADLYYRIAVIELHVPNLEQRGPQEKAAIFKALLQKELKYDIDDLPPWLLNRVEKTVFSGNVRELSNLVERVSIVRRQFGTWDTQRLERALLSFQSYRTPANSAQRDAMDPAAGGRSEQALPAESTERERIIEVLNANGWRRLDSASALGISRKVLWEKMRKFQINGQGEDVQP